MYTTCCRHLSIGTGGQVYLGILRRVGECHVWEGGRRGLKLGTCIQDISKCLICMRRIYARGVIFSWGGAEVSFDLTTWSLNIVIVDSL